MTQPNWRPVASALKIPALPEGGIWSVAVEYVTGPRKLKIAARGRWSVYAGQDCGPDGDGFAEPVDKCLATNAPRGSLIAKIGGGTAERSGAILPVGRLTVIELPDPSAAGVTPVRGPLFLTMNDDPSKFADHSGEIEIDIWEAY